MGNAMKENVCHIADRTLRIVIGLALLALLFTDSSYKWWGLVGFVPLATGLFKFCPGYALFGLSTCPDNKKS
jgi:hypothetical protein